MTMEEAEKYYKDFHGDTYLMWHETGKDTMNEFLNMKIADDILAKWDEDLLEQDFSWMEELDDRTWHYHADILKTLDTGHIQDITGYVARLLDDMEKMPGRVDLHNRMDIIENMHDSVTFHRSPVKMICERTPYGLRLDKIMQEIMNFKCVDEPESAGYFRVKASDETRKQKYCDEYNQAFAKYFRG